MLAGNIQPFRFRYKALGMVHDYGCSICKRPSQENIAPANISQTNDELMVFRQSTKVYLRPQKQYLKEGSHTPHHNCGPMVCVIKEKKEHNHVQTTKGVSS
jgi:hypothetical protein